MKRGDVLENEDWWYPTPPTGSQEEKFREDAKWERDDEPEEEEDDG